MESIDKPENRELPLTRAEATVLAELRRREQAASRPRLADAYRRVLELARSGDHIDGILVAHLVREILSATPGALGIELAPQRLDYENRVKELSNRWPVDKRAGEPPPGVIIDLRRLIDDQDRATGRSRAGPRALLAQEDRARAGFIPDPSIQRWVDLSIRGSGLAHRLRNLDRELPSADDARRLSEELTATLLATIAPFFEGTGELDALLALESPTNTDAERVADLLRTASQYAYFFDRAGERWLRPLISVRQLLKSPPELVDVGGGYVRAPDWPQGRFLTRLAPADPEAVLKIVKKIPTSGNPRVVAEIVSATRALPTTLAVQLVDQIRSRMSIPLAVEFAGIEASALAHDLAQAGEVEHASALLIAVADAALRSRRDAKWHLDQILAEPVDILAVSSRTIGAALRRLLKDRLAKMGASNRYSTTWLWRIDRRSQYGADEIWLLANSLFRVLLANPLEPARALTAKLFADRQPVLARIAFAAVARRPDLMEKSGPLLFEVERWDDASTTRHEFRQALRAIWVSASDVARNTLLQYAQSAEPAAKISERLAGDNVPEAPSREEVRRRWRSELLFGIRDCIPSAWLDRLGPLDFVEDNGSTEPVAEWSGPVSAVPEDELATMDPDRVMRILQSWNTADAPSLDAPGPEGLAIAAANTIASRLPQFAHLASQVTALKARFVAAITNTLEQRLRENQIPDREVAVKFALDIGSAFLRANSSDLWSNEVKRDLAGIIAQAANSNILDEPASLTAVDVIDRLLHDSDPTLASEERDLAGGHDIGMLALNSVRGTATTAAIELLLLSRRGGRVRHADKTSRLLRIALARDYSRSVRAAVGIRLPWLLAADPGQQAEWLQLLFDTEVSAGARGATWDAYLLYSRFFLDTATMLSNQYEAAVARLSSRSRDAQSRLRDRDLQLGIHLAMAHVLGMPAEADRSWLARFYDRSQDWLRAGVTRWLAQQAAAANTQRPIRDRARAFLQDRLEGGDTLGAEELKAFGWIARGDDPDGQVLERIVLPALERTAGATKDESGVADLIARRSNANPLAAAKSLRLLVDGDPWHSLPHIASDELRRALDVLSTTANPQAREISESVVHTLGARGFHEYRDLIRTDGRR